MWTVGWKLHRPVPMHCLLMVSLWSLYMRTCTLTALCVHLPHRAVCMHLQLFVHLQLCVYMYALTAVYPFELIRSGSNLLVGVNYHGPGRITVAESCNPLPATWPWAPLEMLQSSDCDACVVTGHCCAGWSRCWCTVVWRRCSITVGLRHGTRLDCEVWCTTTN